MLNLTYDLIARRIDHSLLNPTLTPDELAAGCKLAREYRAASVCIKPFSVDVAVALLGGSETLVGTVVGFPHGGNATKTKVFEASLACDAGAAELDMVVNIGEVIAGEWNKVRDDIDAVTQLAHARGAIVKVIFENCFLNDDQKRRLCAICGEVRADYVKTSTGYGSGGSTAADLKLMRAAAPSWVKLKAAGGIRDLAGAIAAVELGCDRLGASKTAEILDELRATLAGAASVAVKAGGGAIGGGY